MIHNTHRYVWGTVEKRILALIGLILVWLVPCAVNAHAAGSANPLPPTSFLLSENEEQVVVYSSWDQSLTVWAVPQGRLLGKMFSNKDNGFADAKVIALSQDAHSCWLIDSIWVEDASPKLSGKNNEPRRTRKKVLRKWDFMTKSEKYRVI